MYPNVVVGLETGVYGMVVIRQMPFEAMATNASGANRKRENQKTSWALYEKTGGSQDAATSKHRVSKIPSCSSGLLETEKNAATTEHRSGISVVLVCVWSAALGI